MEISLLVKLKEIAFVPLDKILFIFMKLDRHREEFLYFFSFTAYAHHCLYPWEIVLPSLLLGQAETYNLHGEFQHVVVSLIPINVSIHFEIH